MGKANHNFKDENEASYLTQGDGDECPACRQDYQGSCPLNNSECPCAKDEKDEADVEDKKSDFDDVDNLDAVLGDDKEADRLTEEEEDFSADADAEDG